MDGRTWVVFSFVALLAAALASAGAAADAPARRGAVFGAPLAFEPNAGQTAAGVRFLARGPDYTLYLSDRAAVFALPRPPAAAGDAPGALRIRLEFAGSGSDTAPAGLDRQARYSNYFIGNDARRWRTHVANFARVLYRGVYDGVDLVFRERATGLLEYDFVVAPGSDPAAIRLRFSHVDRLEIDGRGDLLARVQDVVLTSKAPVVYQMIGNEKRRVDGRYVVIGECEVGFAVGAYDASQPLVIDPILSYSTYLGGGDVDAAEAVAVDGEGHAYVAGTTQSMDFPVVGAADASYNGFGDIFVTKFTPEGTDVVYSTYIGGAQEVDAAHAIALDADNNVYLTGSTHADDFPLVGAVQNARHNEEAFVTKLSADGSTLVYSTFLGGGDNDAGVGIAVDAEGSAYIAGETLSPDLATTPGAFDLTYNGPARGFPGDAFVAKLNEDGSALDYLTYLGGSDSDGASAIALDENGNAYIAGKSSSADFPGNGQASSLDGTLGGTRDALVAKLDAAGASVLYWTFVGGDAVDVANGIAVDADHNAYVTGWTASDDFPTTAGVYQPADRPEDDAYVFKLNAAATALIYSTYLGGDATDEGFAVAIDGKGNAYVTGLTESTDFPQRFPLQADQPGLDAFVTKVEPAGTGLAYSTYLGGDDFEEGRAIAVDGAGSAYIVGETDSQDFPLYPPDRPYRTDQFRQDGFVTKIAAGQEPFRFEYVAKIVCGAQTDPLEMRLARGFYATTVNIHSPGDAENRIYKKLALTYPPPEQAPGDILPIGEHLLHYDEALKTDCTEIRQRLFKDGFPKPAAYIEGFVVVQSTRHLDVTTVYTTATVDDHGQAVDHSSIDVEQIAERDLGVDLRIDKTAAVFPFHIGDNLTLFAVLYRLDIENSGPETAKGLHVFDELVLASVNTVSVLAVLESPIDLPPGGSIANLTGTGTSASFDLQLGDLDSGNSLAARFWSLVLAYETGGPASVSLQNTATLDSQGAEISPANNTIVIDTQLIP